MTWSARLGGVACAVSGVLLVAPGVAAAGARISVSGGAADEVAGAVVFRVHLAGPHGAPVRVRFQTMDGTATSGDDYVARSGTLRFAGDRRTIVVRVRLRQDGVREPDETLRLRLFAPRRARIVKATATATIRGDLFGPIPAPDPPDEAPPPVISIDGAGLLEDDAGSTAVRLPVSLSRSAAATVTVDWATVGGTAGAGTDFTAAGGTVTFLPGETAKTVSVAVPGDTSAEPAEFFSVVLSNPANGILASGQTGGMTEFPLAGGGSDIAAGPDGAVWVAQSSASKIVRMTTEGSVTGSWPVGPFPGAIAAGPKGRLWFTTTGTTYPGAPPDTVGSIDASGEVAEFPLTPKTSGWQDNDPLGIVGGPDGNAWFTERLGERVGQVTPTGTVTEIPLTDGRHPRGIAVGADGNLWFSAEDRHIGRVTPALALTEFVTDALAFDIATGADGALWFTEPGPSRVGRITTAGSITMFQLRDYSHPREIVAGPDGNLWLGSIDGAALTRMKPSGTTTEFPWPTSALGSGPDGNLWFSRPGAIARLDVALPAATVSIGDDD